MAGKHIYRDDSQPTAYNRICSDSLERMLKLYVLKMSMIMLSFVAALIGPVYILMMDLWLHYTRYEFHFFMKIHSKS